MNRKHYTFIGLLVLGLLSSVVTCVRQKNENKLLVHVAEAKNKRHLDSVSKYVGENQRLKSAQRFLRDSLSILNSGYTELLNVTQKLSLADSLQKEEIRKGKLRFGIPGATQLQPVLAAAYGNNAFDELGILDKKLTNQMKISSNYNGIVLHKDTIISNQKIVIKKLAQIAKPNFWQRLKDWFIGMALGGGAALFLL